METLPREVITVSKHELEPFKQGRRVGCYLLGKTVGEGSFAKVKEAIHIVTGEKVAVKIIDKKRAREDRYISKNLRREAKILQLVRHANIIQLLEVLETDNYYYLVMEYCSGGELLDYICLRKRLEEATARRLVSQLVSAVDVMHNSGIVHRDLKIENFLLNQNEDLKIIDFGLSNTIPSPCLDEYERTGVFQQLLNTHCGSPAYAAPELLAQKQYGPQVDIWSIGINMYAMLTGYLPYMMEPFNVMEMYEKMMQRKMTPIPSFLSKECRDLLMRLLEPVPEWRITLKQVMRHKWFTGTCHIPRSIPLGDMMYSKKELCESVLYYMKYNLKIKTKDTINAVISNRAVHASAIYHLLVQRLGRYLKERKSMDNSSCQQFSKVEVIKKANLTNENNSGSVPVKTKKFSFRGRKIDPNSRSQPALVHENNIKNAIKDITIRNKSQGDYVEELIGNRSEFIANEMRRRETFHNDRSNCSQKTNSSKIVKRHHKRSASATNTNDIEEAFQNHIMSSNGFRKNSEANVTNREELPPRSPEEVLITSRKMSFDSLLEDTKLLNKTTEDESEGNKVSHDSTQKFDANFGRSLSIEFTNMEENTKDQKESSPGWSITKIVKQPPLKTENIIRDSAVKYTGEGTDQSQTTKRVNLNYQPKSETKKQDGGETKTIEKLDQKVEDIKNIYKFRTSETFKNSTRPENSKQSIRPITPEKLKTIKRPVTPDFDHNFNITSYRTDSSVKPVRRTLSADKQDNKSSLHVETEHLKNTKLDEIYISNTQNLKHKTKFDQHPEVEGGWKPDLDTMRSKNDSKTQAKRVYSLPNKESPEPTEELKPEIHSHLTDLNNNSMSRHKERVTRGLVKQRMHQLQSIERENQTANEIKFTQLSPTITKISPAKKTLELNVTQFAQFKSETKPYDVNNNSIKKNTRLVTLKPLELNFNFKIQRKKKAYSQKQQTKSLTDITVAQCSEKPTENQILSPKNKYNEDKNDISRHIDQGSDQTSSISYENDMAYDNAVMTVEPKRSKTTIKITARSSKTDSGNRTKIYIRNVQSEGKATKEKESSDESEKNNHSRAEDDLALQNITKLGNQFENSSFDSGFFGNNNSSSTEEENNATSPCTESPIKTKLNERIPLEETHSVKYRCHPIHKPEFTKTGKVYNRDSSAELGMITEEGNIYRSNIKRWGSVDLEPTQERAQFVPRSAEIKRNILQSSRELSETANLNNNFMGIAQKKVRTQSCKQYPIQRTVTGSAMPKFQRSASFGMTNKTSRSLPATRCVSPQGLDAELERDKVIAFAHALETAAWRKKSNSLR